MLKKERKCFFENFLLNLFTIRLKIIIIKKSLNDKNDEKMVKGKKFKKKIRNSKK
jgi:hypothetical protein